jgi:hypothetical protein
VGADGDFVLIRVVDGFHNWALRGSTKEFGKSINWQIRIRTRALQIRLKLKAQSDHFATLIGSHFKISPFFSRSSLTAGDDA